MRHLDFGVFIHRFIVILWSLRVQKEKRKIQPIAPLKQLFDLLQARFLMTSADLFVRDVT
jgi:hypothetical protein